MPAKPRSGPECRVAITGGEDDRLLRLDKAPAAACRAIDRR
jgi:hypothetical protein